MRVAGWLQESNNVREIQRKRRQINELMFQIIMTYFLVLHNQQSCQLENIQSCQKSSSWNHENEAVSRFSFLRMFENISEAWFFCCSVPVKKIFPLIDDLHNSKIEWGSKLAKMQHTSVAGIWTSIQTMLDHLYWNIIQNFRYGNVIMQCNLLPSSVKNISSFELVHTN